MEDKKTTVNIIAGIIIGLILGFLISCAIVDDLDRFTIPLTDKTFQRVANIEKDNHENSN